MKRRILILFLLLAVALSGCGYEEPPGLSLIGYAVRESETVSAAIGEIITWQLDSSEAFRARREELRAAGNLDEVPEDDTEAIRAKYDELQTHIAAIQSESEELGARTVPEDEASQLTLQAAKDYFAMLESASGDLSTVFEYYFAITEGVKPMTEYEGAENTTGYVDYSLMAGQLSQVVGQAQKALAQVEYPSYMKDSHDAFLARVDEYQGFCQDFSIAVQMMDPLRIYSCNYRLQRLGIMMENSNDALVDDFNLQFRRVLERLEGPVAELRVEILSNLQKIRGQS